MTILREGRWAFLGSPSWKNSHDGYQSLVRSLDSNDPYFQITCLSQVQSGDSCWAEGQASASEQKSISLSKNIQSYKWGNQSSSWRRRVVVRSLPCQVSLRRERRNMGRRIRRRPIRLMNPPRRNTRKTRKTRSDLALAAWCSSDVVFSESSWSLLIFADLCRGPLVMIHNVKIFWTTKHQQHTVHLSASLFEAALSFGPAVGTFVGGLNSSVNFCCWAMAIESNYISWEMGQVCREHDRVQETGKMLAALRIQMLKPIMIQSWSSLRLLSFQIPFPNTCCPPIQMISCQVLALASDVWSKRFPMGLRPQHGTSD